MYAETVSVIIPVYNVESYLDRCVKSVIAQTYPYLDIVLVDDGSTDRSGMLCDQWAAKDNRIRVIHRENGGLSAARNTGITAALGDYISFVDSDDFVDPDMIAKLYRALEEHGAELSICNFYYVDEAGNSLKWLNETPLFRDEVLSGVEAIKKMQTERHGGCYDLAWNKLYQRTLFSELRFPEGKLCEDGFISHRLLGMCTRVSCISDVCYYYTQRTGSIMHSGNPVIFLHQAEARLDRMLYCDDRHLGRCAGIAYWKAAMYLADTYQHGGKAQQLQAEMENVLSILRINKSLMKYCALKEKTQLSLVCFSPELYCFLFRNPLRLRSKNKRKLITKILTSSIEEAI